MTWQKGEVVAEYEASRRNVIYGLAAAGAAVPLLAACGSSDPESSDTPTDTASSPGGTHVTDGGGIKTSDIPVGGGKVFADEKFVVTQPKAGEFKAFTAVCTHLGCTVSKVADGTINCPCHGSKYSIEDGSVEGGPAPKALAEKKVTQTGTTLTVS